MGRARGEKRGEFNLGFVFTSKWPLSLPFLSLSIQFSQSSQLMKRSSQSQIRWGRVTESLLIACSSMLGDKPATVDK